MIDQATEGYWTLLAALPKEIREQAHKQFRLYEANPDHPSVNFNPLKNTRRPVWSARVNDNYRALAIRTADERGQAVMLWFWIGTHAEYDKITARL
jgi:plasmid maintenance system killer protein